MFVYNLSVTCTYACSFYFVHTNPLWYGVISKLENEALVGQMIEQLLLIDGYESRWRAKVLDVVNERSKNPMFVIEDDVDGEWRFKRLYDW